MKNKLLPFLMFVLFLSCKKEPDVKPAPTDSKTHRVDFSVNGFSQIHDGKISSMPGTLISSRSATGPLKYLTYLCFTYDPVDPDTYEEKYTLIDSASRTTADPDFGKFYSNLPAGTYKIYMIGSTCPIHVDLGDGLPPSLQYLNNRADLAFAKTEITVSDESISKEINLHRMVGQVEFILNDALPSSLDKIDVEIATEVQGYYFEYSVLLPNLWYKFNNVTLTEKISPADLGKSGYRIAFFVFNSPALMEGDSPSLQITLRGYSKDKLIAEKTIYDVNNLTNIKTTYRGSLFDSSPSLNPSSFRRAGNTAFADLKAYDFKPGAID